MAVINRIEDVLQSDTVPRPKRRGVTFVNRGSVVGIAEYRAFEFPAGTGRTWRVDPIDYRTGMRIAELELQLLEIGRATKAMAASGSATPAMAREMNERSGAFCAEAMALAGRLMIPTGARKWRLKLARRFGWNPLRKAGFAEIAAVTGFLAVCLTSSQSRVRRIEAAATN